MMNTNQALWEKGDFTKIADLMRASGSALVAGLDVAPPIRALDLGCGDGTTAIPLARAGADVVGIDIARNLVEAGRRRAKGEGLERVQFHQGDACALHGVEDRSFDLTLSMFGAMFAPRPHDAAREMVRVTKPGGRVVMGNWIPNDPRSFVSQLLKLSAQYLPPPPEGFVSPMLWGVEAHVRERFELAGVPRDRIGFSEAVFTFESDAVSPAQVVDLFRRYYGPTMNAFEAAERLGKTDELRERLEELARGHDTGGGRGTSITAPYLRVTVRP